jgi:hypothetical protein
MSLSRDDILGADDLPVHRVDVPEWGGTVNVRSMTGYERDQFETSLTSGKDKSVNLKNIRARLVSLTAVDDNGERLFTDADVDALGRKSAAALDRVFAEAQILNGLRDKDVEELAEN